MDPLRAFMLRKTLDDEAEIARDQAKGYPDESAMYYYCQGRASAFTQAVEWVDRCMSGPRPDPGTDDLPPGAP